MALLETAQSNFNNGSTIDPIFTVLTPAGSTVSQGSGQLTVTLTTSDVSGDEAGVYTAATYDLTGSFTQLKAVTVPNVGNTWPALCVYNTPNGDLRIGLRAGVLDASFNLVSKATVAYNATTMLYWRIREAAGTIYFEYSATGTAGTADWTTLYSMATSLAGAITAVGAFIVNRAQAGVPAATSSFVADDLSIVASGGAALTGTLLGTGTFSATLTEQAALGGTLTGVGTLAGTLAEQAALSGTLVGTGSLNGILTEQAALAGVLAGTGTLNGVLGVTAPLSGSLAGVGTLSGTLSPGGVQTPLRLTAGGVVGVRSVTGGQEGVREVAGGQAGARAQNGGQGGVRVVTGGQEGARWS